MSLLIIPAVLVLGVVVYWCTRAGFTLLAHALPLLAKLGKFLDRPVHR